MTNIRAIPALDDNYIWAIEAPDSNAVTLVDPGDYQAVHHYLQREQRQLVAILITHHHHDHTAAVHQLQAAALPVYGPEKEQISGVNQPLREGDTIAIESCNLQIEVLETPGHTRGHLSYWTEGRLFCGDTLFSGGCGRVFDGTIDQLYHSLCRIAALPGSTLLYPAHEYTLENLAFAAIAEPENRAIERYRHQVSRRRAEHHPSLPTTVALEQEINPFLHSGNATLKKRAEQFCGHSLTSESEQFATVRRWKDHFDRQR
ncbi:MAG: hydroxyacylglutathione hydrolase [Gammaproteobacteria bacterium]|nr:hydroxyacylglutathione hydrolase [Gammaproteobacteria bacterium]